MSSKLSILSIVLALLAASFIVLYIDYYYIRPQAIDFEIKSSFDVPLSRFIISVYFVSVFSILFASSTHFLITKYLATLLNNHIPSVIIIKAILISKFAYILIYFFKAVYFIFLPRHFYLDEVINFTRFSFWKHLGITNLYINSISLSDILYLIIFILCLKRLDVKNSLLIGGLSYTLYLIMYFFFSIVLPLGLF